MDIIDKVAKAIRIRDSQDEFACARAALEALRDPPDAMLLTIGAPYGGKIERPLGLQARRDAWNRMIDYALGNP